ncbi:MAG: MATE family efflux transporter [Clostridia bacterium]|nr:MATE family efflux transporter [Clostridia bacterium]
MSILTKDKPFYKTLFTIALPVALQQLISLAVVMLDNVMVGSLGDISLSAVSQANQVTVFFTFFVRGISGGAALLISQYWGKKDTGRIRQIFSMTFITTVVLAGSVTLFVFLFPDTVVKFFSNNTDILSEATSYIKIACFSYILFAVSDTFIAMLRCIEIVKITFIVSIISFFTNLGGNYILIFGKLGLPAMGVRGAATATVIARGIELIIVMLFFFRGQKKLTVRPKDLFYAEKPMWKDFFRYGIPVIVGDVQWGLVGVVKAVIIGRLTVEMMAAVSITDVVMQLGLIFANGLAAGACVIIGKTVGVNDFAKTREYSRSIEIIFAVVGVIMGTLVFTLRFIPVSLYTEISEHTKDLAMQLLAIGAVSLMGTSYHMACFTGINRGAGDSRFVFFVDMICGWLVVVPLSAISAAGYLNSWSPFFTLPLVYLCTRIDQCFKWIIALIRLRGNRWIRNVTRE